MMGNSLVNDATPMSFNRFFLNDYVRLDVDSSIIGSATLTSQLASPTGGYPTAFAARAYDIVAFQPYIGGLVTIGTEADALEDIFQEMLDGPTDDPVVYLYEGWPSTASTAGDYQAYWDGVVIDSDSTTMVLKRQAFDYLLARARANVDADFLVIPTGEVLREIDVQARAGNIPGVSTVDDIHRDSSHLNDIGRYAAGVTIYCTLQKKPLEDSERWRLYAMGSAPVLTKAVSDIIEGIVWDVVSNDPRTGVP